MRAVCADHPAGRPLETAAPTTPTLGRSLRPRGACQCPRPRGGLRRCPHCCIRAAPAATRARLHPRLGWTEHPRGPWSPGSAVPLSGSAAARTSPLPPTPGPDGRNAGSRPTETAAACGDGLRGAEGLSLPTGLSPVRLLRSGLRARKGEASHLGPSKLPAAGRAGPPRPSLPRAEGQRFLKVMERQSKNQYTIPKV